MAGSLIGHGSTFALGSGGATETFTTIKGCTSIDLGSNKVDIHDTTDLGSAANVRTFIGGLENPGDATAKFNVVPGDPTQTALLAAKDGAVHDFKVIYPGAVRTVTFQGIVTSVDESVPDDKLATFTIKIQITAPKVYS